MASISRSSLEVSGRYCWNYCYRNAVVTRNGWAKWMNWGHSLLTRDIPTRKIYKRQLKTLHPGIVMKLWYYCCGICVWVFYWESRCFDWDASGTVVSACVFHLSDWGCIPAICILLFDYRLYYKSSLTLKEWRFNLRVLARKNPFCPLNVNWESFFDRSKSLCRNK